ncbi:LPXTG cell wall anchor domain-containing protein [Listeria monocytogenes]|nr:LPXTG cell wall anchor domain-containing protein [Listeria monocytogenes]
MTTLILGGTLIPITAVLAEGLNDTDAPKSEEIATAESVTTTETTTIAEESSEIDVEASQENSSSEEQPLTTESTEETEINPSDSSTSESNTDSSNTNTAIAEDSPGVDVYFCSPGEGIGNAIVRPIHLDGKVGETWSYNFPDSFEDENGKTWYNTYSLGDGNTHVTGTFLNELSFAVNWYTDTPTVDENNRALLEQTITDSKPYLNKDKYQSQYVDALDQAIKAGEQALADNPQVQSRSLFASTSTGTVFQPHIEAINTALADVKAHPVVPQDSTDDSTNTTDTSTSDSSSTNTTDTTSTSSTNEGTDTSKETIIPVSTKQNTDTSTNKKDTLPQTGESVNPWVTIAGLVALASTTFAWFFKRKKA